MLGQCLPTRPLNRVTVWDAERGIGKKTPIFGAAVGGSSAITVFRRIAVQVSLPLHERPASSELARGSRLCTVRFPIPHSRLALVLSFPFQSSSKGVARADAQLARETVQPSLSLLVHPNEFEATLIPPRPSNERLRDD